MTNDDDITSRTLLDAEFEGQAAETLQPSSSSLEPTVESEPSALEEKIRQKMREQPRIRKDPLIGAYLATGLSLSPRLARVAWGLCQGAAASHGPACRHQGASERVSNQ